jgi:hypothetical protein
MRIIERTVYQFDELSDKAKEAARDEWRQASQHDDWWDYIYEDAVRMGALLGIDIRIKEGRPRNTSTPAIYFSGFWSQGDGACFEGSYNFVSDAPKLIFAEAPQDETLLAIAQKLTVLQTTAYLRYNARLYANITTSGHYSHSGTMNVDATFVDHPAEAPNVPESMDEALTALMRRFADWIYSQLEAEDEWLNSDECINESLSQDHYEFDENGAMI